MARFLREARRQGGVTTWAHFCNLPGAESPIDIALGLVDAIDLITYVEGTFDLDRSSWLAARVADDPDSKSRILPRGLTVFAHTNPIYFLRGGTKVLEPSSTGNLSDADQVISNRVPPLLALEIESADRTASDRPAAS
jgi:hypothetical protein